MATCEAFEVDIEMRLHGALDAEESRRLDEHLAGCEGCRGFQAAASGTERLLREEPASPTRDFAGELRARAERFARDYRRRMRMGLLWLLTVPAVYLLLKGPSAFVRNLVEVALLSVGITGLWTFAEWVRSRPLVEVLAVARAEGDLFVGYRRELERRLRLLRQRIWSNVIFVPLLAIFAFSPPISTRFCLLEIACILGCGVQFWYDLRAKRRLRRELAELG